MKILVVNDLLQGGGVERLMQDLVMYFHEKYEMTILTEYKDLVFSRIYPNDVKYLYQHEGEHIRITPKIKNKFIWEKRQYEERLLKRHIEREKFDVMLCMKDGWTVKLAMKYGASIPRKFAWNHTDYRTSYYTHDIFGSEIAEVNVMKQFDRVVGVSRMIEEHMKAVIGDPGNLCVKYNPVNYCVIRKQMMEPVTDVKRSERPLFVSVGRLNYQKGYDTLLEICALLNQEGCQYDVWIIGGGESWNDYQVQRDLEDQVRKYKLDNVYLLGPKSNPYKYIKIADWFLSSSRYEGYSYVSQEAAIVGTPVLLTECSGVQELLDTHHNGIMVENSIRGLYRGMKDVIEHPELRQKYIDEAVHYPASYYEDERYKAIEELFSE